MTKKELKELGISEKLFNRWNFLMNELLVTAKRFFDDAEQVDNDNIIAINGHEVYVTFVNNNFLEIHVDKNKTEIMRLRDQGDTALIINLVFNLVK